MSNLFRAGMQRLRKNRMFWLCMFAVAVYVLFACFCDYKEMQQYDVVYLFDDVIFLYVVPLGILIAMVLGLFVGTEYSEGTIRNKIISGKSRVQIYLSGLFVSAFAAVGLYATGLLVSCAAGIPIFGFTKASAGRVFCMVAVGGLASIAYASFFYAIAMVCQSRAHTVMIDELLSFILLFAAIYVLQKLSAPQMIEQGYIGSDGQFVMENVTNPGYLTGMSREVYAFVLDLLPSGQTIQLMEGLLGGANTVRMAVLAVADILVSSAAGMLLFGRRDIK